SAEVLPAEGMGQKVEQRTLFEVTFGQNLKEQSKSDLDKWNNIAAVWGNHLKKEVRRKMLAAKQHYQALQVLKALSLEITAHEYPLTEISLKQFRDAERPDKACYKALVASEHSIKTLWDLREVERSVHVRIQHFPSHPIVWLLDLEIKDSERTEQGNI